MNIGIRFPQNGLHNSLKCETYKGIIFLGSSSIGEISFRPLTGTVCKVGYDIAEADRGKGFASAALAKMVSDVWDWGFETILTGVRSDNFASKAVLFKNGFRVDYVTDEADGKYYQCRLERSWAEEAKKAYWFK